MITHTLAFSYSIYILKYIWKVKVKIRNNPLIPYSNKSNSFLITLQLASQAEEY